MDNTVGSLTQQQESLIIGSLLGDAYMRIIDGRNDAFLEINHSVKAREYVDWKFNILKDICKSPPKERVSGKDGRKAYRFTTRQHPQLTQIMHKFYKHGRKTIPKDLELTPLSLAVWFMDDGSKTKKGDVYLNTQQFSFSEQRRLLHVLRKFGLKARLNKDKKYYRIRLLKESVVRFNEIIRPYIIDSMLYKMSYDPVETSSNMLGSASNAKC